MRRFAVLVALCMSLLAACGGSDDGSDDGAKQLTQEQAELLATVRFRNFDAGVRAVTVTIPASTAQGAGSDGQVAGWVDFVGHLGYASAEQGGSPLGTLAWGPDRIAVNESSEAPAPFPIPDDGWRSDELDPQTSSLTQALVIVLNLGSDRPENPLLLRQSDAAFVRTDDIDGRPVTVLAGPSPATSAAAPDAASSSSTSDRIRYWIADDGLLLRVEAKLTGTTDWTVIDLADTDQTLDAEQITRLLGGA